MNYQSTVLQEFVLFGIKQVLACKFAAVFFFLLLFSRFFTFGLYRYDFLFVSMMVTQLIFIKLGLESLDELKVIFCFHLIGLIFELFKTSPVINSWSYPEPAFFKIVTVPLYSGFMYSAVASYVIQVWRIFQIRVSAYPHALFTIPFAIIIYAHFFLKYLGVDLKWILIFLVFVLYFKTSVSFVVIKTRRQMPLVIGFSLVAFFIWIAENVSTFLGAWQYPHQNNGWDFVSNSKIGAWFLLYIVSFIVVTQLRIFKEKQ